MRQGSRLRLSSQPAGDGAVSPSAASSPVSASVSDLLRVSKIDSKFVNGGLEGEDEAVWKERRKEEERLKAERLQAEEAERERLRLAEEESEREAEQERVREKEKEKEREKERIREQREREKAREQREKEREQRVRVVHNGVNGVTPAGGTTILISAPLSVSASASSPTALIPSPPPSTTRTRRRKHADGTPFADEEQKTPSTLPASASPRPFDANNPFDRLLAQAAASANTPYSPVAAAAVAGAVSPAAGARLPAVAVPRYPQTPPLQSRSMKGSSSSSISSPVSPILSPSSSSSSTLAVNSHNSHLPHSLSTSSLPASTLQSFVSSMEDKLLPTHSSTSLSSATALASPALLLPPSTPPRPSTANGPSAAAFSSSPAASSFALTDLESFEHDRINFLRRGGHFIAHLFKQRHTSAAAVMKGRQYSLSCSLSCPDLNKILISSENGSLSFYFEETAALLASAGSSMSSLTSSGSSSSSLIPPTASASSSSHHHHRGPSSSLLSAHDLHTSSTFYSSSHPVPTHSVLHPSSDLIDVCSGFYDVTAEALSKHRKHAPLFDQSCCFTVFFVSSAPLYLQARSREEKSIWMNALLWLKDLTSEDLRESLFLFQRDTLAVASERRRRESEGVQPSSGSGGGGSSGSGKTGRQRAMSLGKRTGKTSTADTGRRGTVAGSARARRGSSSYDAELDDVAMKSVQVERRRKEGEKELRDEDNKKATAAAGGGKDRTAAASASNFLTKIRQHTAMKPSASSPVSTPSPFTSLTVNVNSSRSPSQLGRAEPQHDFLTGPSLDTERWVQDRFTDVLLHGQIFSYFHHRHDVGQLIYLSCDEQLKHVRYGRLTEEHCRELNTAFPPSLPVSFPSSFSSSFPYDHVIPSCTILDVVTGESCPLFGMVKWAFSLTFHTYKGSAAKVKAMHLSVFSSSERLTWVKALKWLKGHTSNVSQPYAVRRVAYLDTDLQWKSSSDEEMLKQFQLEKEELGRGGFASVFLATHAPTRSKFAVKIFAKYSITIENEIAVLKEIRHEHVVSYYGCFPIGADGDGEQDRKTMLIMEYCDAGSLHDLLARQKEKMKEQHIAYVLKCTLAALAYLHSKNIIHRDIKSANILLKKTGAVKITDFVSRQPQPLPVSLSLSCC